MVRKIAILSVMCAVVAAVVIFYAPVKQTLLSDKSFLELTQASVWADLQGIEFQHRKMPGMKMPTLLRGAAGSSNYDVLGVYGRHTDSPYVWIVLKENAGVNGIFSMPHNEDYYLQCRDLERIEATEIVDAEVSRSLRSHCVN